MRILFLGDVVGRPGRQLVTTELPRLRREHNADFVIVNGENAAAGFGITKDTASELFAAGADCVTTGNHVWAAKGNQPFLEEEIRVLRPANFAPGLPGRGSWIYRTESAGTIGVINLVGRIFMDPADCPFRTAMALVEDLSRQCDAIVVDFHAEATSEKHALASYLDGRVTAVLGTHTHVQTADEQVMPGGTAFISDVGVTGPRGGTTIGVRTDQIIGKFLTGLPVKFEVPKGGPAMLSAVVVEQAPRGMSAASIRRVQVLTDGAETV